MNPLDRITPAELGRRLKAARLMAGITEAQAAAAIGADESTLTALKRGERRLSATKIVQLCDLYQTSPGRMLKPNAIHTNPEDWSFTHIRRTKAAIEEKAT